MDAAFTVGNYSVRRDGKSRDASITLADQNRVWKARVDFVPEPNDNGRPTVEMWDDHSSVVRMAADFLDSFVELLRNESPVYVSFSTDADVFFVTGKETRGAGEA